EGDCRSARRPLHQSQTHRSRTVQRRGGRSRADRPARGGARPDWPYPDGWRKDGRLKVARTPDELAVRPRSVALGTFDGVHVGHQRVIETVRSVAPDLAPTVVTFWPHPRIVLGNAVGLLATLERRLELLAAAGIEETLVVEFTP